MYSGRMDIARQLDAVDTLLTDPEVLPDTLEGHSTSSGYWR